MAFVLELPVRSVTIIMGVKRKQDKCAARRGRRLPIIEKLSHGDMIALATYISSPKP
jgi:hypothetical protein